MHFAMVWTDPLGPVGPAPDLEAFASLRQIVFRFQHDGPNVFGDGDFMAIGIANQATRRDVLGREPMQSREGKLVKFQLRGCRLGVVDPATDNRVGARHQFLELCVGFVFGPSQNLPLGGQLFFHHIQPGHAHAPCEKKCRRGIEGHRL